MGKSLTPRFLLDETLPFAARDQVREQLINYIHLGVLRPGDRLPAVRELAQQLGVNLKTAFGIYHELARDGMVEIRPQSGAFVRYSGAKADQSYREGVARFLSRVIRRAEQFNLTPRRLARLLLSRKGTTPRLRWAVMECNREQLALFSRQIEREFDVEAFPVLLGGDERAVLRQAREADLLVTTDFHWDEVQRLAARSRREAVRIRLNPSFLKMVVANARKGFFPMVVPETSYESRFRRALAALAPPQVADRVVLVRSGDKQRVKAVLGKATRAYVSALCYDEIRATAPPALELITMRDVIARESLRDLRRSLG